jgi:hypothetical protein
MSTLFKSPLATATRTPDLPVPKVARMPVETDPSALAAAQRTRASALRRRGRQSTIMTDMGGDMVGSSGQSLGA